MSKEMCSMSVIEREYLIQIAYLSEGMFGCEVNSNFGEAKQWKHKLKQATDNYYELIHGDANDHR